MSKKEQSVLALVFGRKGTGKTTWLKKSLRKNKGKKSILIIDVLDNYEGIDDQTFKNAEHLLEYLSAYRDNKVTCRLNTTDFNECIAAIIGSYDLGNVAIFMDECDTVFGNVMSPAIAEVVLRGRNQGTDLILSSLRPQRVNIDVRNNADLIVCYPIVNKVSLKSVCDEFGNDALYEAIKSLTGHDYVRYDVNTADLKIYVTRKGA